MTVDGNSGEPDGIERRVIETLVDLREERGWSQSELARRMAEAGWPKYTQMTVSRTEKGERPIRLNEAEALAEVFGVELFSLWLPRELRRYTATSENVERLAKQLEDLIGRYLNELHTLAIQADHADLAEDEVSYVVAQIMATPEVITDSVRKRKARETKTWLEDNAALVNPTGRAAEANDRFWSLPPEKRKLEDLFGELNGEHSEEA